ncbi:MAG: glycosyltransferase family 2 protein, partial [Planctomycetales bacterium]|nr:glycosyltransferase family 2 protein [Planctomycetales bacterium]
MSVDSVTIVMVPRERYSGLPQAIDSLYEKTGVPFKLIVVDGCLPKHIKEAVDLRASQYGFEFIYRDYPLLPNEARNIGIQLCQTRYIVFVDNDVRFSSNWLPPLLDSAEEFSAALVGPTIFDGTKEEGKIHAAGGKMWFDEVDGHRRYHMLPSHMQQQLSDVNDSLIRGPATMLEFHVLLARTDFFRQHGLLDEKLSTWADHDDLVLTATQVGLPVIYDPRSCVEYDDPGTSNNV